MREVGSIAFEYVVPPPATSAELFRKLLTCGGRIVRASELSASTRAGADMRGEVFVDGEGNAFAWVSGSGQSSAVGFGG